ncbi:MAG TPA: transglycosylase domain-containing protein, partial [Candidatus Binatia bacterium]|nr:transglycosylase domain-containing protein [Candidatus Binatia bacterium]
MAGDRPLKQWPRKHKKRLLWIVAALAAVSLLFWFSLPRRLFDSPVSPLLLAADGRLLDARLAVDEQWRFPRLMSVPQRYFQVLVQTEDRRFFVHPGVDLLAGARALVQNIRRRRIVSGGSTISMQVIRMARKNRGRTYLEKAREIILALRLERSFSKKEILNLYAANAPFGGNIVGIDAASWFYFGRSAEALSWAEAAFLAVLPNDPGLVTTARGRQALQKKRDALLHRLRQRRLLSGLEYSLALAEQVPAGPRPVPRLASHLLATLVAARPGERLFQSTLEPRLQETLLRIVRSEGEQLLNRNIRNLAALIIDNWQGTVVAYVGNVSRSRPAEHGQDIDLIQSPRSTGSILKPFLYAAMLQEGSLTPRTLVSDTRVHFSGYIPENFDRRFRGAVPARDALAWSLNIPAIRMLQAYGIPRFYNLLKKWGMTTLTRPPGGYGLTLILGGAEGTL